MHNFMHIFVYIIMHPVENINPFPPCFFSIFYFYVAFLQRRCYKLIE